jgi:hypothetical protein
VPVRRDRRRLAGAALAAALLVSLAPAVATAAPGTSAPGGAPVAAAAATASTSGNAWRQDVRGAGLHPRSAAMVANVAGQVSSRYGGVAAFNVWQYNTPIYTVPAGQPRITVKFDDCQGKGHVPSGLYGAGGHFVGVPLPADALVSPGADRQVSVYSPSTDQLWELWKATKRSDGWYACWGGRLDRVSTSPGYFPGTFGASASGLALAQGALRVADVRAGRADHALALQLPDVGHWRTWSYPAQRSDGTDTSWDAVPTGTRLRLDPRVDVDALGLHPIAAAVARTAQQHGFVVTDRAGAVGVQAESGEPEKIRTGTNPWGALMGSTPAYAVMKGFPWQRLQALPKDWGKPAAP